MSVQSSLDHWQILQSILNAASGAHLAYLDNDFNFIQVNQAYADGCGLRPEELVGKSHFALFPHAENEAIFSRVRETDEAVRFRDKPFEFADQPQRGITYWDWTLAPVRVCGGQVLGYILSLAETTERRRAEDALRASEERSRDQATKLATVLDAVPALIWMTSDAQCRQITLNRAASEFARHFCGAAAAESMPRYRIMQNGVELDPHDRPLQFVARSGQELRNQTLEFHFDDGQVSFLLGDVVPVLDYKDRPAGAIACFVDITSRKQAEVALQESEERLRLALHASSMATWDWDITSGKIVWNEQGYLALGYQPGSIEPSYQAWASRVHPDDRPGAEAVLQLAMDQKTEYHTEFRAILPDGTVRWLEVRGRFYYDAAGKPVRCYGVMMDITDRRQIGRASCRERVYI